MSDWFDELIQDCEINGIGFPSQDALKDFAEAAEQELDGKYSAWGLCENFSVEQAALLSSGYLPEDYAFDFDEWEVKNWPTGLYATFTALKNAVTTGTLPALIQYQHLRYNKCVVLDTAQTTIAVGDLVNWFRARGKTPYMFGPMRMPSDSKLEEDIKVGYLDRNNSKFSLKLEAAINAWGAVSRIPSLKVSPKQAIIEWLRENAAGYGLVKDDGSVNETGIEEIAKVAHWRPKGGATKTPEITEKQKKSDYKKEDDPVSTIPPAPDLPF
jgi:hypothetical protein